jgi:hypothetical protein
MANYRIDIGEIANYYGGLSVIQKEDKYYWIIENYDTDFDNLSEWEEISKELYDSLIVHNNKLKNMQ